MGQTRYPDELRERATRMALEALADPTRAKGAIRRIADELGVHPEALRTWVRQAWDRTRAPGLAPPLTRRSGSRSRRWGSESCEEPTRSQRAHRLVYRGGV